MGLNRKAQRTITQQDAAETRTVNRERKAKEHARRDARMLEKLKAGSLPYTPEVMSWLSVKLGKPSTRITAEDISNLMS